MSKSPPAAKSLWEKPQHVSSPRFQYWLKKEISEKDILSSFSSPMKPPSSPQRREESSSPDAVPRRLRAHRISRASNDVQYQNEENYLFAGVQDVIALVGRTASASSEQMSELLFGSNNKSGSEPKQGMVRKRKSKSTALAPASLLSKNNQNDG